MTVSSTCLSAQASRDIEAACAALSSFLDVQKEKREGLHNSI